MSETAAIAVRLGISPMSTMGYSYSGGRVSLRDADTKWTWNVLHPWAKAANVHAFFSHSRTLQVGYDGDGLPILSSPMGVGSAGRLAGAAAWANFWSRWSRYPIAGRPTRTITDEYGNRITVWLKPGMSPIAAPGTSVHEADTYQDRALAVDAIGWEDGEWVSTLAGNAQLLTFVNTGNEPWHSQPDGYRKSKSQLMEDLRVRPLPSFPTLPKIPLATTPGEEMFYPITPIRNSDTRLFGPPVPAGTILTFGLADSFPQDVTAVALNLTVLGDGRAGHVTVWPDGLTVPKTSMINLVNTGAAYGSIIVGVVNRSFRLRATVDAHFIADISGYWT